VCRFVAPMARSSVMGAVVDLESQHLLVVRSGEVGIGDGDVDVAEA